MDIHDLFHVCKTGDVDRVQYLVEMKEIDIDIRDKWDSTPLYYACLCGHRDIVEYLLERGARCEANTFDGERCLYGALNDDIRSLLKKYCVISSRTIRRDVYDEFFRKLLQDTTYSDFLFKVHGQEFPAHRCILSARCPFFADMLATKWENKTIVELNHTLMSPKAFAAVLQYLYTGTMEIPMDLTESCLRLAKQCHLEELLEEIEKKLKVMKAWESTKPCIPQRISTFVLESNASLHRDMAIPYHLATPKELNMHWAYGELPFETDIMPQSYPDICFIVDGLKFLCHKMFFCGRSDYFKALVEDHFGETSHGGSLASMTLHNVSVDVFLRVVQYIYTDDCSFHAGIVGDVLMMADMYLLPGLKKRCASALMSYVDVHNVVNMIRTSRLYNLPRLGLYCAEYIGKHLPKMCPRDDFRELVLDDACNVKGREETDSIEIIDEIRYTISNMVITFSYVEEAHENLKMIDDMLEELELEG